VTIGSSRAAIALGAAALIAYVVVMFWPYLVATLVRGSSVTAWTNVATAPIRGRVPPRLPLPGSIVGADGVIMEVTNDLLDPAPAYLAEAALAAAKARMAAAEQRLEALRALDGERRELMKRYAADFRTDLDTEVVASERRIVLLEARLATANEMAERSRNIADSGYRSRDFRDEGRLRALEAEAEIAAERRLLDRTRRRRTSAQDGLFREPDGSSPAWAYDDWRESKTAIKSATLDVEIARAAAVEAEHAVLAARKTLTLQHVAPVRAPPGAVLRSIVVGASAAVNIGDPIARWVDCNDLLVDAPVSDAALPLIAVGGRAEVVLEGEGRWRKATVIAVRGAAETIGSADLAAVAKGRAQGDAQAILKLSAGVTEFGTCPVGRAAYVHFPGAGLFAVLLARLGLH
jgi:multidrug resistance efflux pump